MTVDPSQGQQGVIFGNFLSMLAMTMIFVTDLHHLSVAALGSSFTLFHPGEWMPVGDFAQVAVKLVADSFRIGLQVSAPFLAFGLVFNLGLGVLAKLMPQLQIFFIATPLSIGGGMVLFALLISTIMLWYIDHVRDGLSQLVAS
jgi:flagellar biosynthetic protein FliR